MALVYPLIYTFGLKEDIAALLDLIVNDTPGVAEKVAEASKNICRYCFLSAIRC